ncbi:Barley B recombinant-like protein A [Platanthera zijinensis]|uniref:GAGA-binding transcriptional activator n=1 Tax=Platanthera zijinensis TaxID=2320716 RepID=A0AAP0G154_9ASPA
MEEAEAVEMQRRGRFFRQPQFNGGERITMPFLAVGHGCSYAHQECSIPDFFPLRRCIFPPKNIPDLSSFPAGFEREMISYHQNGDGAKMLQVFSGGHQQPLNRYEALLPEAAVDGNNSARALQTLQLVDPSTGPEIAASKKSSKPRRREESVKSSTKRRPAKKSLDMVINGIELDLSGIPAPLCTCTGQPQQCYRWGAGGWQSACCTTTISIYPLPMSTKRRGARISGRKMSKGAFKKVLEKLAGEGQDFSSPINLKPFWAKHGTNKFRTIR